MENNGGPITPVAPPVDIAIVSTTSYAGFWLRAAAAIIDTFIVNVIFALLSFLYFWFFAKNNPSLSDSMQIAVSIISVFVWIIYFPFVESRGGATYGKQFVGIKVLNTSGEPIGFLRSLGRSLAKTISALIVMIGFIMAAFTNKKQGLHDIIASCIVVKTKEISAAKIWGAIIVIILLCIGVAVTALTQLLFILSSFFGGGLNIKTSSNQPVVIQTENNITTFATSSINPVSPYVFPHSKEEYDEYFSKPMTGLDSLNSFRGPHTSAGPALLAFDSFGGLNIALPIIPNLSENNGYVWIDLDSIISKNEQDILRKDSISEKDRVKELDFSMQYEPVRFYYKNYRLESRIVTDAKPSDIKTVKGTLYFKIPLDSDSGIFYEKSYPFTIDN